MIPQNLKTGGIIPLPICIYGSRNLKISDSRNLRISKSYKWTPAPGRIVKGPGASGRYVLRVARPRGISRDKVTGCMYVLPVARPEGIQRDQGPKVSTFYEWQSLKGY